MIEKSQNKKGGGLHDAGSSEEKMEELFSLEESEILKQNDEYKEMKRQLSKLSANDVKKISWG